MNPTNEFKSKYKKSCDLLGVGYDADKYEIKFHHRLPILGYRIGGFAYLTDVKTVPDGELEKLKGLDVLVVSALQRRQHISHQTLDEAVALIGKVAPRRAYLTHLSHNMGLHEEVEEELMEGVHVGYDGLELMVNG